MKIIKAKVIGRTEFGNKKEKTYKVVYVAYKSDFVDGMKCASCFIDGNLPKVGDEVKVVENGRYTNVIEDELS